MAQRGRGTGRAPDWVRLGLEDIVAKRRDAPYRSGTCSSWVKAKTSEMEGGEPAGIAVEFRHVQPTGAVGEGVTEADGRKGHD
jgi:hypothetical protein